MKKRFGKKKLLTAAVMAALLAAPGYGYAFKMAPEYVYDNGKPIVEIQFLTQGEGIIGMVDIAGYTLSPSLTDPVKSSAAYWTGIIGPKAKNETPWQVYVTTLAHDQNASASTLSYRREKEDLDETKVNFVA